MRMTSLKLESLADLLSYNLMVLRCAQTEIIDVMPALAEAVTAPEVKQGFHDYLEHVQKRASQLDDLFEMLELNPEGENSLGMAGITDEYRDIADADGASDIIDVGLVSVVKKMIHYETAACLIIRMYAGILDLDDVNADIQQTLDTNPVIDQQLSEIVEHITNMEATGG